MEPMVRTMRHHAHAKHASSRVLRRSLVPRCVKPRVRSAVLSQRCGTDQEPSHRSGRNCAAQGREHLRDPGRAADVTCRPIRFHDHGSGWRLSCGLCRGYVALQRRLRRCRILLVGGKIDWAYAVGRLDLHRLVPDHEFAWFRHCCWHGWRRRFALYGLGWDRRINGRPDRCGRRCRCDVPCSVARSCRHNYTAVCFREPMEGCRFSRDPGSMTRSHVNGRFCLDRLPHHLQERDRLSW